MSTLKVDQILKRTGTGTITLGQSGDTISIPSGTTLAVSGTATGVGGDNKPIFVASCTSNLHNLADSATVLVPYNNEVTDDDNVFTNTASNYKFTVPSGKAGKYFIGASVYIANAANKVVNAWMGIYKNGSSYLIKANQPHYDSESDRMQFSTTIIADLAVADYLQVYLFANIQSSGTWSIKGDSDGTYFFANKLIT
tara:strand:+ start:694 stop:1284 length:591 start_codon:yes stop_codon:yes gene_type:complete